MHFWKGKNLPVFAINQLVLSLVIVLMTLNQD